MAHAVAGSKGGPFTNSVSTCRRDAYHHLTDPHAQSRSFSTVGSSTTSDNNPGASLNTHVAANPTPWGAKGIWGSGTLGSGLTSRVALRNPASRDAPLPATNNHGDGVANKTGSGALVDSSTTDDSAYRSKWSAMPPLPSTRTVSHAAYPDSHYSPQRSVSNAGLPFSFSATQQSFSTLSSRQPAINLSSNGAAQARTNYGSTFSNPPVNKIGEHPPTVYTKFDRPVDPNLPKLPDSGRGSMWDSSPTDERSGQLAWRTGAPGSAAASRTASQARSHKSEDRPVFTKPDYSRPSQRPSYSNSRTTSLSSQGNSSYASSMLPSADQIALQLGQLSMNSGNRPPSSFNRTYATPPSNNSMHPTRGGRDASHDLTHPAGAGADFHDARDAGTGYIGADPSSPRRLPQNSAEWTNPGFNNRFLQLSAGQPGKQTQQQHHPNGNDNYSSWDLSSAPRTAGQWAMLASSCMAGNGSSPTSLPDGSYIDPRFQQLFESHLRNAYHPMFNQYAFPPQLPLGFPGSFVPFTPMNMGGGIDANGNSQGASTSTNLCSNLMYEFKLNTKARYELKDIYDHIAEFSGDQHGSRFIQNKLETANSDEKERVFQEIEPNTIPLMTDVFGNYVIQKFFEHGDQTHKRALANKMKGQVLNLSMQMYGCRVVQKALDHVLVDQQAQLVRELDGHVMRCVKDQNGNHVIQKAIERCPANTIDFIIKAFVGQVQHLSIHPYGCRVIQRCLERCEPQPKAMIMAELMGGIQGMISDQYGNYVVQHVVEHDDGEAKRHVLNIVAGNLESYSRHKFASNVVEKCLEKSDDEWRRRVIYTLANDDIMRCEGEGLIVGLIKDNFGNYVIRKSSCLPSPIIPLTQKSHQKNYSKRSAWKTTPISSTS